MGKNLSEQWEKNKKKYEKTGKYEDLGIAGVKKEFLEHPERFPKETEKIYKNVQYITCQTGEPQPLTQCKIKQKNKPEKEIEIRKATIEDSNKTRLQIEDQQIIHSFMTPKRCKKEQDKLICKGDEYE